MAHRLSVTKVHFNARGNPEDKRPLGDLDGDGAMATSFFANHFASAMWNERDDKDEIGDTSGKRHAIRGIGEALATGQPDVVAGVMLAGERGIVAEYYEDDFETRSGSRVESTIEAPRVLALAYMPHREIEGYLVTHAYHNRYFKTGLLASLRLAVRDFYNGAVTVNTEPWMPPADVVAMLRQGPILSIDLQRRQRVDNYQGFTHSGGGSLTLKLTPEGNPNARFDVEELVQAAEDDDKLVEMLNVGGIRYHELAVTVKSRGSTRTLVLGSQNAEWASWDVSTELSNQALPDPDELVTAAMTLLKGQGILK